MPNEKDTWRNFKVLKELDKSQEITTTNQEQDAEAVTLNKNENYEVELIKESIQEK